MSRRKGLTQGLEQAVEPPKEGQHIVRVAGSRGGNIVEVEYPDGRNTLCLMPNKFNKKLWVKRGGYLMIEEGVTETADGATAGSSGKASSSAAGSRITGTIIAVLYEEQMKELQKLGAWPEEFSKSAASKSSNNLEDMMPPAESSSDGEEEEQAAAGTGSAGQGAAGQVGAGGEDAEGSSEEEDDGLPPLQQNTNRKVIVHYVSDDEDDDEDD